MMTEITHASGAPPARLWVRFSDETDAGSGAIATLRAHRPRAGRPAVVELHAGPVPGSFPADVNTVVPGTGRLVLVAVLHRRPDIDHAHFSRHWRDEHARFGRQIAGARCYVQLHTPEGEPVDGVVLVAFDDPETLKSGLGAPIISVEARQDEASFIDHTRSWSMVCDLLPAAVTT